MHNSASLTSAYSHAIHNTVKIYTSSIAHKNSLVTLSGQQHPLLSPLETIDMFSVYL